MANTTANMGLVLNVVGQTQDPTWSNNINSDWAIIDAHDHSIGKGAQITPAGININQDLPFNFNNITNVRSWKMQNNASTLPTADINCGYFSNGNFFINNNSGTPVQITNGSGLNFSSLGTIGGDYGQPGVTAAVTYSNTTKFYTFTQSSGITAPLNVSTVAISEATSGAQSVSIAAPTGVTAYTFTLPAAVPTASSVMTFDTSATASFTPFTSANTAGTIVARDSSGNINTAGITATGTVGITGPLNVTGNATITGNETVSGTLAVTGATTLTGGIVTNFNSENLKMATFSGTFVTGSHVLSVTGAVAIYGVTGTYLTSVTDFIFDLDPTAPAYLNNSFSFPDIGVTVNTTSVSYTILVMYV